ncbi:hypothetical protein C8J56DRAFT_1169122 [Mycena floridula]|nr:hypothetical protein C8J56DRAFT_1169122 [Mycena floridula]
MVIYNFPAVHSPFFLSIVSLPQLDFDLLMEIFKSLEVCDVVAIRSSFTSYPLLHGATALLLDLHASETVPRPDRREVVTRIDQALRLNRLQVPTSIALNFSPTGTHCFSALVFPFLYWCPRSYQPAEKETFAFAVVSTKKTPDLPEITLVLEARRGQFAATVVKTQSGIELSVYSIRDHQRSQSIHLVRSAMVPAMITARNPSIGYGLIASLRETDVYCPRQLHIQTRYPVPHHEAVNQVTIPLPFETYTRLCSIQILAQICCCSLSRYIYTCIILLP